MSSFSARVFYSFCLVGWLGLLGGSQRLLGAQSSYGEMIDVPLDLEATGAHLNPFEGNEDPSTEAQDSKVGKKGGEVAVTLALVAGAGAGMGAVWSIYRDDGKLVWRAHNAVYGMAVAAGVMGLVGAPVLGVLEVAILRCQGKASEVSFWDGAANGFKGGYGCLGGCLEGACG